LAPQAIPRLRRRERAAWTKDAVTSARTVRRSGMSVRATSHPMGAATAQQITAELNAKMTVRDQRIEEVGSVASAKRNRDGEAAGAVHERCNRRARTAATGSGGNSAAENPSRIGSDTSNAPILPFPSSGGG